MMLPTEKEPLTAAAAKARLVAPLKFAAVHYAASESCSGCRVDNVPHTGPAKVRRQHSPSKYPLYSLLCS